MLNPQEKTTLEIQPSINSRNKQEIKGRKRTKIRRQLKTKLELKAENENGVLREQYHA